MFFTYSANALGIDVEYNYFAQHPNQISWVDTCGFWQTKDHNGFYRITHASLYGQSFIYVQWLETNQDGINTVLHTLSISELNNDHADISLENLHCKSTETGAVVSAKAYFGHEVKDGIISINILHPPGKYRYTRSNPSIKQVLPTRSFAETLRGNMQTATLSSTEPVLNKTNLNRVKHHILETGRRCTYSNMYNNNPCMVLQEFELYLNPDPGGPYGDPQWNINCDVTLGDFNTLVVHWKNAVNTYSVIDFRHEQAISIQEDNGGAAPRDIRKLKDALEAAILASLKAIKASEEILKAR